MLWIHLNRRLISHTQARPVYGNVRAYVKFNLFYLFVVFFLHHFSIFFAICRLFCFISFVHFFLLCCFAWVFIVYVRIPHRFSHVYLTTLLLLCFNIYMYLCNSFRFHSIFHLYIHLDAWALAFLCVRIERWDSPSHTPNGPLFFVNLCSVVLHGDVTHVQCGCCIYSLIFELLRMSEWVEEREASKHIQFPLLNTCTIFTIQCMLRSYN